ncbi:MAG TPA: 50S ribosomal protein L15 [Armatimonadetes bacterium]|nr:50S ribosomal protein L15 [Armatimonadota bacterium]
MRLDDLRPNEGANTARKRVGRGHGAGTGKTSGRGQKGQGSRSGGKVRPGFEGGQTPLSMRTPKLRGPYSRRSRNIGIFERDFAEVNVGQLNILAAGAEVDQELLADLNLCRRSRHGLRVLGNGELNVALTVTAQHFSASAKAKIEAAGGTVKLLGEQN